jgi:hypothetical protein
MLNVSQVIEILKKEGISESKQMTLRWIRQGDLKAMIVNRKSGYQIAEEDLIDFIIKRKRNKVIGNPSDYNRGYEAGFRELLVQCQIDSSGKLTVHSDSQKWLTLKDAQEILVRELINGENNPVYFRTIKKIFHNSSGEELMNRVCIFQVGDFYKISDLIVTQGAIKTFMKDFEAFKGSKVSNGESGTLSIPEALILYYSFNPGSKVK